MGRIRTLPPECDIDGFVKETAETFLELYMPRLEWLNSLSEEEREKVFKEETEYFKKGFVRDCFNKIKKSRARGYCEPDNDIINHKKIDNE